MSVIARFQRKNAIAPLLLCLLLAAIPLAAQSETSSTKVESHAGASAAEGTEPVSFTRTGDLIQVTIGGKPFTAYKFTPAISKPFLEALRTPGGIAVTRDFPYGNTMPAGGPNDDHPHQRPLYFAHGDVNGADFWGEEAFRNLYHFNGPHPFGRMMLRKVEEMKGGPTSGTIRASFDMLNQHQAYIGTETQQFTFSGTKALRIIDCEFVIIANHGPITLGDTKEGTFAIRRSPQLNVPPGMMIDSKGRRNEAGIWGKRANWVDADGVIDGHHVGIAVFDNPQNFRHPTYWMARDYGLLAANPFGLAEFTHNPKDSGSYTIPDGESMTFRYRVLIHEGTYKQADVAGQYRRYAAGQ